LVCLGVLSQDPTNFEQRNEINDLVFGCEVVDDVRVVARRRTAVALYNAFPLKPHQDALLGSQRTLILHFCEPHSPDKVHHIEFVEEFFLAIFNELLFAFAIPRPETLARGENAPKDPLYEVLERPHVGDWFPAFPDVHHDLVYVVLFNLVSLQVSLQLLEVFLFGFEVQGNQVVASVNST